MKHVPGKKFEIKNANFAVEVNGCYPGGQGRMIRWMENSYQITINGIPMEITERHLDLLESASTITPAEPAYTVNEPIYDVPPAIVEEMVQPEPAEPAKKKTGRPRKAK